jgi:hypothetical protein
VLQRAGRRQHKGRQLTSTVGEKPGDEHDSGDNDEASEGVADDDLDGEATVVDGDLVDGGGRVCEQADTSDACLEANEGLVPRFPKPTTEGHAIFERAEGKVLKKNGALQ